MTAPPTVPPASRAHENWFFALAMAIALLVLATFLVAVHLSAAFGV